MEESLDYRTRTVALSGLVVAGIGFFVTRFTVTLAVYDEPTQFFLAGVVPLVLGLLLAAFGVALVVGSFEPAFVRTTALWCVTGMTAMLVLVVLTLLGSNPGGIESLDSIRSKTYLANFLIGGSVGGTLTGVYAAQNRRHRTTLSRQANRLVILNRLVRHEVLNAVAVIRATAETLDLADGAVIDDGKVDRIVGRSDHVVDTVEDVKYLAERSESAEGDLGPVDLHDCIQGAVETIRERHPSAEYDIATDSATDVSVFANAQLKYVFLNLLENAIEHTTEATPHITVDVDVTPERACVHVTDNGPGLSEAQRATLERGRIADYDDASTGFGLHIVRLLVERFNGKIHTEVTDEGTAVEIVLWRGEEHSIPVLDPGDVRSYGVSLPALGVAVGSSLVAGGLMGVFIQVVGGVVPVIGALYGVADPLVGWITHEFHSIVFGLVFAGFLVAFPERYTAGLRGRLAVGVGWGFALWLVAAGVVMPVWLQLLGLPAPLPNLNPVSFVGHLIWGVSLGILYHVGTARLGSRE